MAKDRSTNTKISFTIWVTYILMLKPPVDQITCCVGSISIFLVLEPLFLLEHVPFFMLKIKVSIGFPTLSPAFQPPPSSHHQGASNSVMSDGASSESSAESTERSDSATLRSWGSDQDR